VQLFQELDEAGIKFSVLVHDIIPAERPEFVSDRYHDIFVEWLRVATSRATFIFVSSDIVGDRIVFWARRAVHAIKAEVIPVKFGSTIFRVPQSRTLLERAYWVLRLGSRPFALSVGTIDRRKNQALLCRVWRALEAELGETEIPRLVLVGRTDLDLHQSEREYFQAFQSKQITILGGVSDRSLAYLYSACLFTVFPSLCEGYGLPVEESLGAGKLCVSADLPNIREHAGTLAWYFDPTSESAAYDCIRRAIGRPDLRKQAERQIAENFWPVPWNQTLRSIVNTITLERG
jgi:glycosyltransferase involved in cell wall biosynthesis